MAETPSKRAKMSTNQLEQLKKHTIVVADTGDIDSIKQFTPTDATTNPSLILASATKPQYEHLLKEAIAFAKSNASSLLIENFLDNSDKKTKSTGATEKEVLDLAIDKVCVNFGLEILKLVDGVVSTEVDARLSFDTELSVARARRIIKLYEKAGIKKERILIKLASTWEGFQAAKILKKENIKCNMTLLFSFSQAIIAAQEEVELISPFVGRILDWNKKNEEKNEKKIASWIDNPSTDPGVLSVKRIYNYYKKHGIKTIVMGASFRNKGEILELTGCDKLTIGPKFLKELGENEELVEAKLTVEKANESKEDMEKIVMTEKEFRWALNEDQMATEKLSEGIRKFAIDIVKLENIVKERLD